MIGFRSLKYPASPDPDAPDYHAQCRAYWQESRVWWANWAHNFGVCLGLLLVVFVVAIAVAVITS
jgi:hypothetical protein